MTGPERVEYDQGLETFGSITCTNVLGGLRGELNQLETAAAALLFAVLLGAVVELHAWY